MLKLLALYCGDLALRSLDSNNSQLAYVADPWKKS